MTMDPSELTLFLNPPDFFRDHAYAEVLKADACRLQITPYVGAPHGYYVVPDESSTTGQAVFCFNHGDDIFRALDEARRMASQGRSQTTTGTQSYQQSVPSTPRTSYGAQYAEDAAGSYFDLPSSNRMAAVVGAPVAPTGESGPSRAVPRPLPPASDYTPDIYPQENVSVIPLEQSIGQPFLYTTTMKLDTAKTDDMKLKMSSAGLEYKLAIDTAEGLTWFYARGFKRVILNKGANDTISDWPTDGERVEKFRLAVSKGPDDAVLEECRRVYGDRSVAHLQLWGHDYAIPMKIACWEWAENKPGYATLLLARVLAQAVCDTTARRSYHGLMGVRGIGARSLPFDRSIENFITFYDALTRDRDYGGHVEALKQFVCRMRHPSTPGGSDNFGRGRSFMHFGTHWPCALPAEHGRSYIPKFGPKIYIWPSQTRSGHWDFEYWLLRLVGLELMVAKVPKPDHESDSPAHWDIIPLSTLDRMVQPSQSTNEPGLHILVDSGTSQTYLPPYVVEEIRTKWLGLPKDAPSRRNELYCEDPQRFKDCDIVFRFLGLDGTTVPFRCSAGEFLCSPYRRRQGGVYVSVASRRVESEENAFSILGQNFFWSAFVKHNFVNYKEDGRYSEKPTGANGPYMQLSPQRIVVKMRSGETEVYGQHRILLHDQLPGRLEGLRQHGDPEPMYM